MIVYVETPMESTKKTTRRIKYTKTKYNSNTSKSKLTSKIYTTVMQYHQQ